MSENTVVELKWKDMGTKNPEDFFYRRGGSSRYAGIITELLGVIREWDPSCKGKIFEAPKDVTEAKRMAYALALTLRRRDTGFTVRYSKANGVMGLLPVCRKRRGPYGKRKSAVKPNV